MHFNWRRDFRVVVSLQLFLVLLNLLAVSWLATRTPLLIFSLVGLGLLLLVQIRLLFQSLQKIYTQLEDFFTSLRHQDTTRQPLPVFYQGQKLARLWQEIQTDIQQLRERNETMLRYYSLLLEKVPVPLLRLQGGKIELINAAARQLLQRSHVRDIEELRPFGDEFVRTIATIKPGEQQLVSLLASQQPVSITVSAASIQLAEGVIKIISLHAIQRELDRQQIHAWQQLVQVLSHEIMNSMTPINSLSKTAQDLLEEYQQQPAQELLSDANEALARVSNRSEHLMAFVSAYRTVAQPLTLAPRHQPVRELLHNVAGLFANDLHAAHIKMELCITPEHLQLYADTSHVEQALINLVKNAIEALTESSSPNPTIRFNAYIHPQGQVVIDLVDNGPGITDEQRENIFVPFYTSRRSGTGIGLFVVQKIMQAHGGTVIYIPQTAGSCFRLMF